jgi:hypothetical protein
VIAHRAISELRLSQQEEMFRSKSMLEAEPERRVEVFCFPYDNDGTNPEGVRRIRVGCKAACLYDGIINRLPIFDPYSLSRWMTGVGSTFKRS